MDDKRRIKFNGEELGEFNLQKLMRMRSNEEIDHTTEFFSQRKNEWLPLAGILEDMEDIQPIGEKVEDMRRLGFKKVRFLAGGDDGDCPSCRAIAEIAHAIDAVPTMPPDDCTCNPWCRLCVIVEP